MTCSTLAHAPTSLSSEMEAYSTWASPFHQSGHTAHFITSKPNKSAACWAVVQQKHAWWQCSDIDCLFAVSRSTVVALFEACTVPQLHLPITFENSYNYMAYLKRLCGAPSSISDGVILACVICSTCGGSRLSTSGMPWLPVLALLSTSVCCR